MIVVPESLEAARKLLARIEAMEAVVSSVDESKQLHTHPIVKKGKAKGGARDHTQTWAAMVTPKKWKTAQKKNQSAANAQYEKVRNAFRKELRSAVLGYLRGDKDAGAMTRQAKAAFEKAYPEAYRLGLKAAGVSDLDAEGKSSKSGPAVSPDDQNWIKSSLAAERKYWNAFVQDVKDRSFRRFTPEERVDMYVGTLDHAFESGRVIGHPKHAIIYWMMDREKEHCKACDFLQKNSPFTRETLPGVPRDGHTCHGLSRCGCQLKFVTTTYARWQQVSKKHNRAALVRQLAKLRKPKH